VAEAIPAYRARLTGDTGPIAFTALLSGALPFIRPQARPDRSAEPVSAPDTAPAMPATRPLARPPG
jgi:soluble lytic murein transglycosylase